RLVARGRERSSLFFTLPCWARVATRELLMRRVCVFCGSKSGDRPMYADVTRRLGTALVQRGLTLVYGAGHIGLMGILADTVLQAGGEVIGVIPQALVDKELAHSG